MTRIRGKALERNRMAEDGIQMQGVIRRDRNFPRDWLAVPVRFEVDFSSSKQVRH